MPAPPQPKPVSHFALACAGADTRLHLWVVPWQAAPRGAGTAMSGHSDEVKAVAVLDDGTLVTGGRDTTLRLWSKAGAGDGDVLPGHSHTIFSLAPLPGAGVASGSGDMCIRIWRAQRGAVGQPALRCAATLRGHKNMVFALAAAADGALLLSGSADRSVRAWDLAPPPGSPPACLATLKGHSAWVNAVALLPLGAAASASTDGSVRLWHIGRAECTATLAPAGDPGALLCLSWLPHAAVLAAAGDDGALRLWRLRDKEGGLEAAPAPGAPPAGVPAHEGPIRALLALPDGRLASGGDDRAVRLWRLDDGCGAAADGSAELDANADSVYALAAPL